MNLNFDSCYQAILSRDSRFDGVFFVGVSSTGIYCRTVCAVRKPKSENCTFYPSAAAAEQAGYRPCLRCRPELAPGNAHIDSPGRLAAAAAGRIEDGALGELSLEELATNLGVTSRHLRRVVRAEFGVSPVELAQTVRLLMAKRLLTDTDLPVTEVAYASGFSSLRRFNTLFKQRYRLNPSRLRKVRPGGLRPGVLTCELAYRPPLDWGWLLAYLGGRGAQGVESVVGRQYRRTVTLKGCQGWILVEPRAEKNTLRVQVSAELAPVLIPLLARLKHLFDLRADPQTVADRLGALAAAAPGLRVPGAFDGFEVAVRAVLGQQTSVRAATTLMSRLVRAFGEPIQTPFEDLSRLAPTPQCLAEAPVAEIAALGMPGRRAQAVIELAKAVVSGDLALHPGVDVEATMQTIKSLPGLGEWTAQYVAMRALGWPDAFPHTDLGIRKALGDASPREVLERAEAWRPWRAYATIHLWHSLR